MRSFIIAAIAALAFASAAQAQVGPGHQPICRGSKPCGNTCIPMLKTCHAGAPAAPTSGSHGALKHAGGLKARAARRP